MQKIHIANSIAFDEAQRLLEYSPLGLSLILFWRDKEQEWECQFVTENDSHYRATHPFIANAILSAAKQVPQSVEDFAAENERLNAAILAIPQTPAKV